MQWKGPHVVERRVRPVDYVVNVKGKSKVFHVNLLKRYYSRINDADQKRDTSVEGGAVLELASSAIIAADGEGRPDDAVDDDELLDESPCLERDTINDVKLCEELNVEQRAQAQRLIEEFSPVFSNKPGETDLIKYRVKLISDEPIRQTFHRSLLTDRFALLFFFFLLIKLAHNRQLVLMLNLMSQAVFHCTGTHAVYWLSLG